MSVERSRNLLLIHSYNVIGGRAGTVASVIDQHAANLGFVTPASPRFRALDENPPCPRSILDRIICNVRVVLSLDWRSFDLHSYGRDEGVAAPSQMLQVRFPRRFEESCPNALAIICDLYCTVQNVLCPRPFATTDDELAGITWGSPSVACFAAMLKPP